MKLTKKQGNAPPPAQSPWGTYYGPEIWYDPARLDDFGYSALMAHEWGHCLFHSHAPPRPEPGATAIHDPKENGYCVMTYLPNEGDFCAKCVFALRGWTKIDSLP